MNMKRFGLPTLRVAFLAVCATAFASTSMHAQDAPPPPPPAGHGAPSPEQQQKQLDRMTKFLSLTPDQVTQIKAIQADHNTQVQSLMSNGSEPRTNHKAMAQLRKDEMDKTRAVLTDDQKTKYDAMVEKMKEREHEHREGGEGAPPPPAPPSV